MSYCISNLHLHAPTPPSMSKPPVVALHQFAGSALTTGGTNSLESQTFSELQARPKPGVEPSFLFKDRLPIGGSWANWLNLFAE